MGKNNCLFGKALRHKAEKKSKKSLLTVSDIVSLNKCFVDQSIQSNIVTAQTLKNSRLNNRLGIGPLEPIEFRPRNVDGPPEPILLIPRPIPAPPTGRTIRQKRNRKAYRVTLSSDH